MIWMQGIGLFLFGVCQFIRDRWDHEWRRGETRLQIFIRQFLLAGVIVGYLFSVAGIVGSSQQNRKVLKQLNDVGIKTDGISNGMSQVVLILERLISIASSKFPENDKKEGLLKLMTQLESQAKEINYLKRSVSESNERGMKVQAELEYLKLPRTIQNKQIFMNAVAAFKGQQIDIYFSGTDAEIINLVMEFESLLKSAGWNVGVSRADGITARSIIVNTDENSGSESKRAAAILTQAIKTQGLVAQEHTEKITFSMQFSFQGHKGASNAPIRLLVGQKPVG